MVTVMLRIIQNTCSGILPQSLFQLGPISEFEYHQLLKHSPVLRTTLKLINNFHLSNNNLYRVLLKDYLPDLLFVASSGISRARLILLVVSSIFSNLIGGSGSV